MNMSLSKSRSKTKSPFMNENMLKANPSEVMEQINQNGFAIISGAIPIEFIERQRKRWIGKFNKRNIQKKFVRGSLILGENNFLSYSDIPGWCMYRHFEFLWNEAEDPEALLIHCQLHKYRNVMQGFPENYGLEYNDKKYGIYLSTSHYEPEKGHLSLHSDGHEDIPIIHYMLPLTFKGVDYDDGGLFCRNKGGILEDIDALVNPGDLIFFDGRIEHGVKKIGKSKNVGVGRIAVFAVPTLFQGSGKYEVTKRSLKVALKEIGNKMGLINLY